MLKKRPPYSRCQSWQPHQTKLPTSSSQLQEAKARYDMYRVLRKERRQVTRSASRLALVWVVFLQHASTHGLHSTSFFASLSPQQCTFNSMEILRAGVYSPLFYFAERHIQSLPVKISSHAVLTRRIMLFSTSCNSGFVLWELPISE